MRSLKCGTSDGVKYFSYKRESVTWQQIRLLATELWDDHYLKQYRRENVKHEAQVKGNWKIHNWLRRFSIVHVMHLYTPLQFHWFCSQTVGHGLLFTVQDRNQHSLHFLVWDLGIKIRCCFFVPRISRTTADLFRQNVTRISYTQW